MEAAMWGHRRGSTDSEYSEQVAVSNDEKIALMTKDDYGESSPDSNRIIETDVKSGQWQ